MSDEEGSDPKVELVTENCFWIKNALSHEEQRNLIRFVRNRTEKSRKQARPSAALTRTPKTLMLGKAEGEPCAKFSYENKEDSSSTAVLFVKKMNEILWRKGLHEHARGRVKRVSVAAIRYEGPSAVFPPHVDRCEDSFVYLASLGRTARFTVKSPSMDKRRDIAFGSGDAIIFDPSSEAALLHSVEGIESFATKSGEALEREFPALVKGCRIGLQRRAFFTT